MQWWLLSLLLAFLKCYASGKNKDMALFIQCNVIPSIGYYSLKKEEQNSKFDCGVSCRTDATCYGIAYKSGMCYKLSAFGNVASSIINTLPPVLVKEAHVPMVSNPFPPPDVRFSFDGADSNVARYVPDDVSIVTAHGKIGNGVNLTSISDYAQIGVDVASSCPIATNNCTNGLTLPIWAKISQKTTGKNIIMDNGSMRLKENEGCLSGRLDNWTSEKDKETYSYIYTGFDTYDEWTHLVLTVSPSYEIQLYINGQEAALSVTSKGYQSLVPSDPQGMMLGTSLSNSLDPALNGVLLLDEFLAWDQQLHPEYIRLWSKYLP